VVPSGRSADHHFTIVERVRLDPPKHEGRCPASTGVLFARGAVFPDLTTKFSPQPWIGCRGAPAPFRASACRNPVRWLRPPGVGKRCHAERAFRNDTEAPLNGPRKEGTGCWARDLGLLKEHSMHSFQLEGLTDYRFWRASPLRLLYFPEASPESGCGESSQQEGHAEASTACGTGGAVPELPGSRAQVSRRTTASGSDGLLSACAWTRSDLERRRAFLERCRRSGPRSRPKSGDMYTTSLIWLCRRARSRTSRG
jgi:hypothetical protein